MDGMLISIIVFMVVYAAITFELVNKAVAAFSGVSVLVLLIKWESYIDWNSLLILFVKL